MKFLKSFLGEGVTVLVGVEGLAYAFIVLLGVSGGVEVTLYGYSWRV